MAVASISLKSNVSDDVLIVGLYLESFEACLHI